MEAPGLHETNFNTQCYNDAIDLTSRWKVRLDKLFFQNEAQKVLYKPVLVSDLITLLVICGGVIACQKSGKPENQQNQINPSVPQIHNQSQIKSI